MTRLNLCDDALPQRFAGRGKLLGVTRNLSGVAGTLQAGYRCLGRGAPSLNGGHLLLQIRLIDFAQLEQPEQPLALLVERPEEFPGRDQVAVGVISCRPML